MAFNKGKSKRRSDQEKKSKSKFESKSLTRIIISLFVAIAAFIGATYYESYLLSDKNVSNVVVAIADIEDGMLIDANNVSKYFTTKEVNSNLVTKSTLTEIEQVNGKVAVDISSGEIITAQRFYDTSYVLDQFEDPVEMTFSISENYRSVSGSIREGDLVDIMEIVTENGSKRSQVIMKSAYVLCVYDSSGAPIARDDKKSTASMFKIFIERSDQEHYNLAFANSQLSISKVVSE